MSWLKKRSKYKRPRKPFDKVRIDEEKEVIQTYGLKNKKEIWKANSAIDRIRGMAKKLITADLEKQNKLLDKLQKQGFKVESIADVLGLTKENWLERRLQTVVFSKGLAQTTKGARQMISHKHITIDNKIVNVPGYMVHVAEEAKIGLINAAKMGKKQTTAKVPIEKPTAPVEKVEEAPTKEKPEKAAPKKTEEKVEAKEEPKNE